MNPERFKNTTSGHVVKSYHQAKEYWAFVPNPLPPEIVPDMALMNALSEADRAIGRLAVVGARMENPSLLLRPFLQREAVYSSRIEGSQADIADVYAFEAGQFRLHEMDSSEAPDVREVINYVRALEYGLEQVQNQPVTLELIKAMHAILLQDVRGRDRMPGSFRNAPMFIGVRGQSIQDARYAAPPVTDMLGALRDLANYIGSADDVPPIVRLALVHYQFEAIHPFADGNGRIGRLLISLLAVSWQLLPFPLLYMSAYFEQNRSRYYDLLLSVSESGAWMDWLLFFLQGVTEQASDTESRARRLHDLQTEWRGRLLDARVSPAVLRLADLLMKSPVITIPQAAELLGVSYPTAQRCVDRLIDKGVLVSVSDSDYGRAFVAQKIVDALAGG